MAGTAIRTGGRIIRQGYRLELDPGDGGPPLMVRASLPPGVLAGARVRVAYDPASRDTVLLESPPTSATGNLFASADESGRA